MYPRLTQWLGSVLLLAAFAVVWVIPLPSLSSRPEVESLERLEGEAGWRITWRSEEGASYKVQRNPTLMPEDWEDVDVVVAAGVSTSLTDTGVDALATRMFWRVVRLGAGDDEPPVVSILQVRLIDDEGQPSLELTVQAVDNVGVVGVAYLEGAALLGNAGEGPPGTWSLVIPVDLEATEPRQFQARAEDAAGNFGFSEVFNYVPGLRSGDLIPLDGDGNPTGDAVLGLRGDGTLNPFAWLPDMNGGGSAGHAFRIDFPDGGSLLDLNGEAFLSGGRIKIGFGEDSPTQLLGADGEPGFMEITAAEGGTLQMKRGGLDYEDLAELMGIDPAVGIRLLAHGSFEILWKGGVLTRDGVLGGVYSLVSPALGLPEIGGYEGEVVDFSEPEPIRMSVKGKLKLGKAASLEISKANPIKLELSPNGGVSLKGTAEVVFADGGRFFADVLLDDPVISLSLRAGNPEVVLMAVLAGLMPENPKQRVPPGTTQAELDTGAADMAAMDRAYKLFIGNARGLRPDELSDNTLVAAPEIENLTGAAADAWITLVKSGLTTDVPAAALIEIVAALTEQARGGGSTPAKTVAAVGKLMKLRKTVESLGQPTLLADIDTSIALTRPALDSALIRPGLVSSEALGVIVAILAKDEFIYDAELSQAVGKILQRTLDLMADELGVEEGVTSIAGNAKIQKITAAEAIKHAKRLAEIANSASLAGIDPQTLPVLPELHSQIFQRGYQAALSGIDKTLGKNDPTGSLAHFAEIDKLQKEEEKFGFAPPNKPTDATLVARLSSLNTLLRQSIVFTPLPDLSSTEIREDFFGQAKIFSAAIEVAGRVSGGDAALADVSAVIFTRLNALLPSATTVQSLTQQTDRNKIFLTLQAGTLHATLLRRYPALSSSYNWNAAPVFDVSVRLGALANAEKDSAFLFKVLKHLIDEEKKIKKAAEKDGADVATLSQVRRRHLQVMGEILDVVRPLAQEEWTIAESRRNAQPEKYGNDGLLPGGIQIDQIGGAINYHRMNGRLEGRFAGRMRLPDIGSSLFIHAASIDSDGRFDIMATGSMQIPGPGSAPAATLAIPISQPLHITLAPESPPRIRGRARMTLENGAVVSVGLRFDDPIYSLQAEATKVKMDLRDAMLAISPPQIGANDESLPWAEYFEGFANWFESFENPDESPDGPPSFDDFMPFGLTVEYDGSALIRSWLARALAEAQQGSDAFVQGTSEFFTDFVEGYRRGIEHLTTEFDALFPPDAEQRARDALKRLLELAEFQKKMAEVFDEMAKANLTGGATFDLTFAEDFLISADVLYRRTVAAISSDSELLKRPELVRETARAGFKLTAAGQLLGLEGGLTKEEVIGFFRQGMNAFLASRGLLPDGTVDLSILGLLDAATVEKTFRDFFDFHADLSLMGDVSEIPSAHLRALAAALGNAALTESSFDPVSGLIDDSGSDEDLITRTRQLHNAYVIAGTRTDPELLPPSEASFSAFLLHKKLIERSKRLPDQAWGPRMELMVAAVMARDLRLSAGGEPLSDVDIAAEELRAIDAFRRLSTGRLQPQDNNLLEQISPRRNEPDFSTIFFGRLEVAATAIFEETAGPWTTAQLPLVNDLREEITRLARLAGSDHTWSAERSPAFLLERLSARVSEVAAATRKAKPPATLAREFLAAVVPDPEVLQVRALLGPDATAIRDTFDPEAAPDEYTVEFIGSARTATQVLLNTSGDVISLRAADPRPLPEPDVDLPGDITIAKAFGGFFYNRETGFFKGTFGGRLLFPDPRAFFEIVTATFDSDGNFAINAVTGVPIKIMDNDRARLTASVAVAGSSSGLDSVAGTGTLSVPFGPDQSGVSNYQGSFTYDSAADGKPFTFSAAVDGVQNEFKLGDDFALYNGNLSVRFSTEEPALLITAGGKAGFFARPDAPAALGADGKFWVVCTISKLEFSATEERLRATFNGGSLKLAQDIFKADPPVGDGFVQLAFAGKLGADWDLAGGGLTFFGNDDPAEPFRVSGSNFKFSVPGIEASEILVTSCELELFGDRFPVLNSLDADFKFPLPGVNASAEPEQVAFNLAVEGWNVDGFLPDDVTVTLTSGLTLFDLDGFGVELLGAGVGSFPPVSLSFSQVEINEEKFTRMELGGGMRLRIENGLIKPADGNTPTSDALITSTSGAMRVTVDGGFGWTFAPNHFPEISLNEVQIQGKFLLGGVLEIGGVNSEFASLRIKGFDDMFTRTSTTNPFTIEITAAIGVPDVGTFQLDGAKFVWRDPDSPVPDFDLAGAGLVVGDSLSKLLGEFMPIYVSSVFLDFLDKDNPVRRPLIGGPGVPGRFDLDNLAFIITARAEFPPSPAVEPGTELPSGPRFGGELRNLRVTYPSGNLLFPEFQLDGVVMGIEGLDIPPLDGIGGQVALLNLDQLRLDPPRPENVTFVGELKANFNGPGVGVLLAASPSRIHGVGLSVDLASVPAGIPLDGYALGGILWTGAAGGISFLDSFADPTEFASYIQRDTSGAIIGADEFPPPGDEGTNPSGIQDPFNELDDELYVKTDLPPTPEGDFDPFDLLKDNWPPRSANPLLEEFPPDSGRQVFKGTRLLAPEANAFLDSIGVVAGDTRTAEEIIQVFLTAMTADIRAQADALVTALLNDSGVDQGGAIADHYRNLTENLVNSFEDVARPILRGILQPVGLADGPSVREQMFDLLTQGVPAFNVTFLGSGTFTHQFVAPVMNVKGTISVSTTGAALSRGELRMIGIPVAEASVGFSLTNELGQISPFLGGLARVGIGPLEMGKLTMAASMPDAASVAVFFDSFIECVVAVISSGAEAQLRLLVENAISAQVPVGQSLDDFLLARTDAEKLAVAGALFEYFAQAAADTLPEQFAMLENDFNELVTCFAVFVSASLNALTPEIGFGGKVLPSLFDIPMTVSGMPLASARMRFGPVLRPPDPNSDETYIDLLGDPAANLATGGLPGVREFSAYAQFSPSAVLLSPLTGTFVATNPSNAAFLGFTAFDSAEMGFSFLIEEWTPEKVILFLTNPPQYFADRTQEFFDTAVFGAGYQMSPFGMNLADGQLRAVFPDSQLHPRRPGGINTARLGNPIRPFDSNGERTLALPTTDELILAAITAGKLKDATFRGFAGELPALFPPPTDPPPQDGNLARVHRVSEQLRAIDPNLTDLSNKSFAKDYFPYGGIIGGGQLAAPQIITRGLPPNWGDLFEKEGLEWLDAFGEVIDYLASTDTVGQLAYYIPAPNPILFPDEDPSEAWDNMTIESLLARLQMDPASLIDRSINTDLYEIDEIALAGWADATLFGIKLGEAEIAYRSELRQLEAYAQIPPNTPGDGNWFNDFFSGSATVTFKLPSDQETGLVTYGAAELFTHIGDNLADIRTLTGAALNDRIGEIEQSMIDALPRASMEISGGVQVPVEFSHVLRSSSGLDFFAFSPFFEPDFEPANFSPYAVAKRRGGIGIGGAFDFGYFPPTGDPIVINAVAQLSLTPSADIAILPAINGLVEVGEFSIPGAPSFTNGLLQFSSSPDDNAPYIAVAGNIEPFVFQLPGPLGPVDLLRAKPLAPATLLGGTFRVLRSVGAPDDLAVDLSLNAMSAAVPLLGPSVAVTMHGGSDGEGGFNPFSFSTAAGQSWSAQIALSAANNPLAPPIFGIGDPFDPGGPALMTFTPSGPLTGSISGVGLDSFTATFSAPTGFEIVFYPGTPHETVVGTPAGESIVFMFDSEGRVYCDLGSLTQFALPGAISGGARIEFGYNPTDPQPDVRLFKNNTAFSGPLTFGSINLVNSAANTFEIRNLGTRVANIGVQVVPSTAANDFTPSVDGMQIEPGGERTVTVVFQPRAAGARSATLRVTSDDPVTPIRNLTLSGTGLAQPIYVASRPNVDFGDTLVGATSTSTFTVGNSGSANMTISSASVTGTGFSVTPTGSATLTPGQSRNYTVSFTPGSLGAATGSLNLSILSPIGPRSIPLAGNGSESRWVTVLDSQTAGTNTQLNAIRMLDASAGFAVGNAGAFLETQDGGRSWTQRNLTRNNLMAIALNGAPPASATPAIYHFDEPVDSTLILDTSGNARNGLMPFTASHRPTRGFGSGRFGSGFHFDGTDDYVELGAIGLPSSFTVSMWVKAEPTSGTRAFLTNTTSSGDLLFFVGSSSSRLRVQSGTLIGQTFTGQVLADWMHIAVRATFSPATGNTSINLFRNGASILNTSFTGPINVDASTRWMVGARRATSTTRSSFYQGALDEVMFFEGALSDEEIAALATTNLQRMVVAGHNGTVLQSFNRGRLWGQHPDLNAFGWRNRARVFESLHYNSAGFVETSSPGAKLYLGGYHIPSGTTRNRRIMIEANHPGVDGIAGNADDEFDLVGITGGPLVTNPEMTGIVGVGNTMRATSTDGTVYTQHLPNGSTSDFTALSGSSGSAFNAIAAHGLFTQYVAVGNTGRILQNNVAVTSGTTQNLRGVAFNASVTPGYHVVGDNGVYLTSSNSGANWQVVNDGLTGNMRAVDAVQVPGGSASEYHVWAAGQSHTINYRPPAQVTGPFMTFFPGKLDYGFVLAGQSRTQEIRISNRGKQPLTISSLGISGPASARFTIPTTSLAQIMPDQTQTLSVRYRPTAASALDLAELTISVAGGSQGPFRVPLSGRSGTQDWLPVALPVTGKVVDVKFIDDTLGYAIAQPLDGSATHLYRTTNGGVSWDRRTNLPTLGGTLKLSALAASNSIAGEFILVGGFLEGPNRGVVLQGIIQDVDIGNGETMLQESWTEKTPGGTSQALPIISLDIRDVPGGGPIAVASTGGANATVWRSTSGSGIIWTTTTNSPSTAFTGGPVRMLLYDERQPESAHMVAASSNELFVRIATASSWLTSSKKLSAFAGSTFKAIDSKPDNVGDFADISWIVGTDGLFFKLKGDQVTGQESVVPASDAEVFGVTNLTGVSFGNASTGYVCGESRIFASGDGGDTWRVSFDAGDQADLLAVSTRSQLRAWVGGSLGDRATIWRYAPPPASPSGLINVADARDWGNVAVGAPSTQIINVANILSTALPLHSIRIETDEPRSRFRLAGTVPTTINAASSINLSVAFDATPEESFAEELEPHWYFRFENEWDSTVFTDDSANARGAEMPETLTRRPTLALSQFRDRALRFDGNDLIEVNQNPGPDNLTGPFAIALWAAPESVSGTRVLVAKDASGGSDLVKFAMNSSGYRVQIRGATFTYTGAGAPPLRWQHLVANFEPSGTSTVVTVYRDGDFLFQTTLTATAGNITGKNWTIGAEYFTSTSPLAHFLGALDDVMLMPRALTESEIARLAGKSSLIGEHRARLVINSGSESGTREVALRATVGAEPRFLTINTEPQGLPVKVDGVDFTAPMSFAIVPFASTSSGAREWIEGSQHRIEVPESVVRNHAGGSVNYRFADWSAGPARQFTLTANRDVALTHTATFVASQIAAPPVAPPPPRPSNGPNPLLTALADAPKGPFLRITDGHLRLPNLAGNDFAITGELFLSLSSIQGQLASTALSLPESGTSKFLEAGASNWRINATAGGPLLLEARPPSLALLGYEVLPDGLTRLEYAPASGPNPAAWTASFQLARDFKPFPDVLEFKKGGVELKWLAVAGPPAFTFALDGGIRVLRLPDNSFALDRNIAVRMNTADFDIGLNDMIAAAGQSSPANLFASGPFTVGWSDVRLQRAGGGPVTLSLVGAPFSYQNSLVATIGGSLNTSGTLRINGSIGEGGVVRIDPSNRFRLEALGSSAFSLEISPRRLALGTPAMRLKSTNQALSNGVVIPGVRFDSTGAFDTGKIALPNLNFDGISVSGPSNGSRDNNHIRLQRDTANRTTFTVKSQQPFFTCDQELALTMTSVNNGVPTVKGSIAGNFCVLPGRVSLDYNSGSSCQFSGSAFGFTVFFGSNCAGVRNDFTGICVLGGCP